MKRPDPGKTLLWNPSEEEVRELPQAGRIPHAHYAAIGRVIDAWGDPEFEIDRVVWELIGVPQPFGACVTSQILSVHSKLRAVRALLHLWGDDSLADEVGRFANNIYELSEIRNRLVHDKRFVLYPTNDVIRFEVTAPKKLTFEAKIEFRAYLDETTRRIKDKVIAFDDIRDKIRDMRAASPDILQRQFPHVIEPRNHKPHQDSDLETQPPPPEASQR
jgi:hypothetical protein